MSEVIETNVAEDINLLNRQIDTMISEFEERYPHLEVERIEIARRTKQSYAGYIKLLGGVDVKVFYK